MFNPILAKHCLMNLHFFKINIHMKRNLLLLCTFLLIKSGLIYSQTVSPVLCLPLNGNANDNSGNSYNGTVQGATLAEDRFGNPNSAYSFNGVDSYISIPDFGNFIDSNETTVSIWCKTNVVKSQCLFMLNPDSAADRFMGLVYYSHNGVSSTIFDHGNLFTTGRLYLETPYQSGWEHYVFVSSKTLNVMRIYKNGIKIGEAFQNSPVKRHNRNLFIGGGHEENTSGFFYNGLIDDFRIFNEALSETQIAILYSDTTACVEIPTSINTTQKNKIQIYPNPSNNGLFKINTNIPIYEIKVMDLMGKKVFESNNLVEINLNFLEKGIYFLTLKTKEDIITQKLIID